MPGTSRMGSAGTAFLHAQQTESGGCDFESGAAIKIPNPHTQSNPPPPKNTSWNCCEIVSFRHSERSEESFPEEILRRFAPQNDAGRYYATVLHFILTPPIQHHSILLHR